MHCRSEVTELGKVREILRKWNIIEGVALTKARCLKAVIEIPDPEDFCYPSPGGQPLET